MYVYWILNFFTRYRSSFPYVFTGYSTIYKIPVPCELQELMASCVPCEFTRYLPISEAHSIVRLLGILPATRAHSFVHSLGTLAFTKALPLLCLVGILPFKRSHSLVHILSILPLQELMCKCARV